MVYDYKTNMPEGYHVESEQLAFFESIKKKKTNRIVLYPNKKLLRIKYIKYFFKHKPIEIIKEDQSKKIYKSDLESGCISENKCSRPLRGKNHIHLPESLDKSIKL